MSLCILTIAFIDEEIPEWSHPGENKGAREP
jgi:hypothetical protein